MNDEDRSPLSLQTPTAIVLPLGLVPGYVSVVKATTMKKRLTRIGPLKAGIVIGILYAVFGLLFVPFFLVMAVIGEGVGMAGTAFLGSVVMCILMPIAYGIAGFVGGVISAALYNLIARITGGLEFEFADVPVPGSAVG